MSTSSRIYLQPEVRSGLGEDTFWTWFERTFPEATFETPTQLNDDDVVLQYATLGAPRHRGGKTIALLWELYPEMIQQLGDNWRNDWKARYERMRLCSQCAHLSVVSTPFMMDFFDEECVMAPIGVNDVFHTRSMREMREKHSIPVHKTVYVWVGSRHEMKGDDRLEQFVAENPDAFFIVAWKHPNNMQGRWAPNNVRQHARLSQDQLAELICSADYFLSTGRLRPWFMSEWEAMMCGVEFKDISGLHRESSPTHSAALKLDWKRNDAAEVWRQLIKRVRSA